MKDIQKQWFGIAVGLRMDPDNAYDLQCVDVIDHYAEFIFGVPWQKCVGAVGGANNIPNVAPSEYWTWHTEGLPQPGDAIIWGGNASNKYGHVAIGESGIDSGGATVIQQNSNGLANQAAHRMRMGWYQGGTGQCTGWLRPRPEKVKGGTSVSNGTKLLTVTAAVATVRTSPKVANNVAPAYPGGIAKGAKIAAVGYVQGQDPFPNDGVQDDAWIKTVSGLYIWANVLGNDLSGLTNVG